MSRPSRIRTFRKVAAAVALVLLVLVGAATAFGVHLLVRSNVEVEHTHRVIERIESAQALLAATEAAGRGYRLTSHQALREELDRLAPRATLAAETLVEVTADNPRQQDRARRLHDRATTQVAEMLRLAELQDREGPSAAIHAMDPAGLVAHMHEVKTLSRQMLVEELELLEQRRATTEHNARVLLAFILLSLAVSLATLWALLANLWREDSRNRRLERETRGALERLQRSQAITERLSEQRRALSEYTGMLQSAQNLDEAMALTSGIFRQLLPHVGGQCYLARASRDLLESRVSFGDAAVSSTDAFQPDRCWALRRGQPHHNRGGAGGVRCAHIERGQSLTDISTLCVPLAAHGETLGMLHASAPTDGGEDDNDAEIIDLIAEQLALAIANLRLRETLRQQSLRDPLTNLFNRRYFEENLRREMLRCERKHLPLALLVLDVDHFKAFNDSHGHSAGDAVLAHVGRTMLSLVRAEDLACRYGGEEFTIVMPEADAATALARAEAIRRIVSQSTVHHNGRTLGPVTMSIGVALFPADGVTPELLFEAGDAALYRAKAEGRNRVLGGQPAQASHANQHA